MSLSLSLSPKYKEPIDTVYTELLVIAMQKWLENFAEEWVEYPFFAMNANANDIANPQCEQTLILKKKTPLISEHLNKTIGLSI